MQIDLFTLFAQIVNFLILVGLLRYFLYGPITRAMDAREQKIAGRLQEAQRREDDAAAEQHRYQEQQDELEAAREKMLDDARRHAEAERRRLENEARSRVDRQQAEWLAALSRQRDAFLAELRRRAGEEVYAVSRQALRDLADEELERHIVESFIRRLAALASAQRDQLKAYIRETETRGRPAEIRSAFDLPDDLRKQVAVLLREQLASRRPPSFSRFDDLICGIELQAAGHVVSWSVASYMDELKENVTRSFARTGMPPAADGGG